MALCICHTIEVGCGRCVAIEVQGSKAGLQMAFSELELAAKALNHASSAWSNKCDVGLSFVALLVGGKIGAAGPPQA